MPPRTAPPLLSQGNDESEATPALLISLRLPGHRPIVVGVGDLPPQSTLIACDPHTDLPADRDESMLDGVGDKLREQKFGRVGHIAHHLPVGELLAQKRSRTTGAARRTRQLPCDLGEHSGEGRRSVRRG